MLILGIQSDHIRMSICILIPVACNSPPTGSLRLPGGRYRHYTNSKQTAKLVLKIIHLNELPGSGLSMSVGIKLPDESIYGIMGRCLGLRLGLTGRHVLPPVSVLFDCNEIQEIVSVWAEISSCSASGSTQSSNDELKSRIVWEVSG